MPNVDWLLLAPHLVLTGFALVVLLMAAAKGERAGAHPAAGWVAFVGSAVTAGVCLWLPRQGELWRGIYVWDPAAAFFCALFAAACALVCLASVAGPYRGEYYGLMLISTVGLMFLVCSGSLLMLYLSLEVSTLTLFVLAGYDRNRDRSSEAALKYLVVAGTSSAVLLFGVSWVFGAAGSTRFEDLNRIFQGLTPGYAWIGMALILVGLAFKIAAAPFHLWAPDVYEGAPSPVSAYLSTVSKAAGFLAIGRLLLLVLPERAQVWVVFVGALAVLSMAFGNFVAIVQTNVKRLLAYSGIAQAGFLLIAVAAANREGLQAVGLYLMLYAFANVGAFLCVFAVGERHDSHALENYDGLSRRSPLLAFALLIFLLSLAGIPPLAGFVGKFLLFAAGMGAGLWWLVLLGAVMSTVSLYYYLLVAKRMYIHAPPEGSGRLRVARPVAAAIAVCVALTVLIGLYPAPWVGWAESIGSFVRL
ncbi:MAG: NADH-quinone oxidoreductase subunit N [Fimbriimonadales bacterium]|nr:NADH-quinone oxidoreductase subunit N [Fimbriimonadales bacterium]